MADQRTMSSQDDNLSDKLSVSQSFWLVKCKAEQVFEYEAILLFGRPVFDLTEMRHDWAKTCLASQHDLPLSKKLIISSPDN